MRIVLVSSYDARRASEFPARHGLAAMRLAAFLAARRPDWIVALRAFEQAIDTDEVANQLIEEGFDAIGLPGYIWTKDWSRQVALRLERTCRLIIVGGPETRSMDVAHWPAGTVFVVGQGEAALLEICRRHQEGLPVPGLDVPAYAAGSAREMAIAAVKPDRSMLDLPDGLPLFSPAFDRLLAPEDRQPAFTWYETARGCIYSCSFCGHNTLPFFATYALEFIEQEVRLMAGRGVRRIFLIDPILGGRPARGKDVLRLFRAHAPQIAITAYMRPEFLDDEFIELLGQANIAELLIGIQTINPEVPQHVRGNNIAKMMRYLPRLVENGVRWRAELIVGLPGDNESGLKESLRFVVDDLRPSTVYGYHLTAIPETKLYNLVGAHDEPNWINIDGRSQVTESRSYTNAQLLRMLRYAGAISSLHNQLVEDGETGLRFADLDRRATAVLDGSGIAGPAPSFFHPLDMAAAMTMWRERGSPKMPERIANVQ